MSWTDRILVHIQPLLALTEMIHIKTSSAD
jgi:hypothetical protein